MKTKMARSELSNEMYIVAFQAGPAWKRRRSLTVISGNAVITPATVKAATRSSAQKFTMNMFLYGFPCWIVSIAKRFWFGWDARGVGLAPLDVRSARWSARFAGTLVDLVHVAIAASLVRSRWSSAGMLAKNWISGNLDQRQLRWYARSKL